MLDKLIESRGHASEQKTIGGFMLSTGFIIISLLLTGVVYSLFTNNLTLGAEAFEISTLVAPVQPAVEPLPEAPPAPDQPQQESRETKLPTRQNNIQRLNESPVNVPTTISVTRNESKARPDSAFILGTRDIDPINTGGPSRTKNDGNGPDPKGISGVAGPAVKKPVDLPEPPDIVSTPPAIKQKKIISGGVVNGRAINLVMPVYPSTVKTLNIKGEVKVQVTIDENGRVISASAVSGHPLLRNSAVTAARASVFSPTTLSDQKVQVSGIIVYRFS